MAQVNRALKFPANAPKTHEGAPAKNINAELQLRRSVMACLLWERTFYESGVSIAERISKLVPKVDPHVVAGIAREARGEYKLRHVPLLLARELARSPESRHVVADLLEDIIQRPDELTEFMAIYWADKRQPLAAKVKQGLARAFRKFNEYQLAKYNRDGMVKLKDVLFLSHAKPKDPEQAAVWKRLIDGELKTPDTWEVGLSGGADKKETFSRLITEGKLGALALLRNLRNMEEAGVNRGLIELGLERMKVERVLPFRFISAAVHAPSLEPHLEKAMFRCTEGMEKFSGKTLILIDVSGSMHAPVSGRSNLTQIDAACGLAILARELNEDVRVYTFSEHTVEVPARRGFGLRDAIHTSQRHWSTMLGAAVRKLAGIPHDRLIVITDEQSHDRVPNPRKGTKSYMINVAAYKNGVGYDKWVHIDGWSEATMRYIQEFENSALDKGM